MIRLGVNVPNFGPEATAEALLDWARFAEDGGFDTLVVSDHVVLTDDVTALYPEPFQDPFVLLAWLAAQTAAVRLGTSVIVLPYRHPLYTARMSSMLQSMSGGRFVLGVGAGWARQEFEALGADHERRGPTTDEYLAIITQEWARRPGPEPIPVWAGGPSRRAIRRAVRHGTAWHPINPEYAWLRDRGLPALRAEAAEQGRAVPELVVRIKARLQPEPAGADRPMGVGTLEQVVGDVRALAGLGAGEVILDTNPDTPRPRDFAAERRHLAEIKLGYAAATTRDGPER
jgi:alkanesulfonate monooxygenase SsuD/methylene tetrahydromethanopterin reductase-like flavin-dependent oxidoreductase (luciferase family)